MFFPGTLAKLFFIELAWEPRGKLRSKICGKGFSNLYCFFTTSLPFHFPVR